MPFLIGHRGAARLALVLLLAGSLAGIAPMRAQAAGACSIFENTYTGYFNAAGQPYDGTRANVVSRPPTTTCTGSAGAGSNFSTSWVMLSGTANVSGVPAYTQVGYTTENFYGGDTLFPCYFAEYDQDGQNYGMPFVPRYRCDLSFTYGQAITYAEQYQSGCACEASLAALATIQTTPFSPLGLWHNLYNVWSSETIWHETNVPGSPAAPAAFSALAVQPYPSSSYIANPTALTAPAPYHPGALESGVVGNAFTSWQQYP